MTEKNGIALTGKAQLTPTNRWQQYILTHPGIKITSLAGLLARVFAGWLEH